MYYTEACVYNAVQETRIVFPSTTSSAVVPVRVLLRRKQLQVCAHLQWIGISAKLTTHLNYGIYLLSISIRRTLQCCVSSSSAGTILLIDRFSITHSFDKEQGFSLRCCQPEYILLNCCSGKERVVKRRNSCCCC